MYIAEQAIRPAFQCKKLIKNLIDIYIYALAKRQFCMGREFPKFAEDEKCRILQIPQEFPYGKFLRGKSLMPSGRERIGISH